MNLDNIYGEFSFHNADFEKVYLIYRLNFLCKQEICKHRAETVFFKLLKGVFWVNLKRNALRKGHRHGS